jgi:hypothetical protein
MKLENDRQIVWIKTSIEAVERLTGRSLEIQRTGHPVREYANQIPLFSFVYSSVLAQVLINKGINWSVVGESEHN